MRLLIPWRMKQWKHSVQTVQHEVERSRRLNGLWTICIAPFWTVRTIKFPEVFILMISVFRICLQPFEPKLFSDSYETSRGNNKTLSLKLFQYLFI